MTSGPTAVIATPEPRSRSVAFRVAVAVLTVGGATLILRALPLFDPGINELWGRLTIVRNQVLAAHDKPEDWRSVAGQASQDLKLIAEEARRAHQRRVGPWQWIVSDRLEEAAFREAQRIAESDLPALIASGPQGNRLRERSIDDALARLDDHLAGASPYLPPIRPVEKQEGLDRKTGVRKPWPVWLIAMTVLESAVLVAAVVWWAGRPRPLRVDSRSDYRP